MDYCQLTTKALTPIYIYLKKEEGVILMLLTLVLTGVGIITSWAITRHFYKKSPQSDDIEKLLKKGLAESMENMIEPALKNISKIAEAALQKPPAEKIILIDDLINAAKKLETIRRSLHPRTKGRIPFHNDAEVALRGYHVGHFIERVPHLEKVTWKQVSYTENGLHRGYKAAIVFEGSGFSPGVTWAERRKGESVPAGRKDYWWREPNIYWGDYLEVSTGDDPEESPLSDHGYEFKLKNPNGKESEWVEFTYPLDIPSLLEKADKYYSQGQALYDSKKYKDAIEPLRKAFTYCDRLLGKSDPKTLEALKIFDTCKQKHQEDLNKD